MKTLLHDLATDIRMLFRVPVSAFFTVVFPSLMLIMMMASYGNPDIGDGIRLSDKYVLIASGMGLVPLTLITFPSWICSSVESSYLLRLKYLHVSLVRVATSNALAHMVVALCGAVVTFAVGVLFYDAKIPDAPALIAYSLQLVVVTASLMLFGAALAFIVRQSAVAMAIGLILMFVVYMLCGVFGDFSAMPANLQGVGNLIPLKYLMNDGFDVWTSTRLMIPRLWTTSAAWAGISAVVAVVAARRRPRRQRKTSKTKES